MRSTLLFLNLCLFSQAFGYKHFVLISAPGSGKGTLSQYLVEKHGYVQVCPGDIFRNEVRLQTELGKKIEPAIQKGDLVDEDIVCVLMEQYLVAVLAQNKRFVLDGFPRSEPSFHFLKKFIQDHNLVHDVCFIQLLVDDEVCLYRALERKICTQCFKVYNASWVKPKINNQCDTCGIPIIARRADTEIPFRKRLEFFHVSIEPLITMAQELYPTVIINGDAALETLQQQYDQLLNIQHS